MFLKNLLLLSIFVQFSVSKILIIIYEDYEVCVEPEQHAGKLDFSELEIFAESDTKVYLNGSLIFMQDIDAPWRWYVFTERFDRDKWHIDTFTKRIPDFCKSIQNPLEPWYFMTSKLEHKNCPFPAGVTFRIFFLIM